MREKHAANTAAAAGDQDDGQDAAAAAALDGVQYCSEHPYRPGSAAAAAAVAGGGICAFCLQEKLGRLVSSSKSSPFFPLGGHPPPSGSPSSPPSFRRTAEPPPPLHPSTTAARKFLSFHRKKTPSSSSSSSSSASAALSAGGGGLKRSKSVAPRPEEQFPYSSSASSLAAESPRKKSFWSFLYLSSSPAYAHQAAPHAASGGAAAHCIVDARAWLRHHDTTACPAVGCATLPCISIAEAPPDHRSHSPSVEAVCDVQPHRHTAASRPPHHAAISPHTSTQQGHAGASGRRPATTRSSCARSAGAAAAGSHSASGAAPLGVPLARSTDGVVPAAPP